MHWESWPTRSGTRELDRGRGHPGTRQKLVQNRFNVVVLGEFKRDNPANHLGIRRAVLSYPSEDLRDGLFLVDTPGVGTIYRHHTEAARQFLPESDAAVFLTS